MIDALQNLDPLSLVGDLVVSPYIRLVTPDPKRRSVTRKQIVEEHFNTSGPPGRARLHRGQPRAGTAYYYFDEGSFRHVVMDSVNPNGYADGSLDQAQFDWLKATIGGTHRQGRARLQPPHEHDDVEPAHPHRRRPAAPAGARRLPSSSTC